jgi:hypothetical protein
MHRAGRPLGTRGVGTGSAGSGYLETLHIATGNKLAHLLAQGGRQGQLPMLPSVHHGPAGLLRGEGGVLCVHE